MLKHHRLLLTSGIAMLSVSLACLAPAFAAQSVELKLQSSKAIQSFFLHKLGDSVDLKEISSTTDMQQITHVRMQETYMDYPVWGADVIAHIPDGKNLTSLSEIVNNPKTTINGIVYQNLTKDLEKTPSTIFSPEYANKVLDHAIKLYQKNHHFDQVTEKQSQLMVFIDDANKARWAFQVSFEIQPEKGMKERPTFIIDAITMHVYYEWNDIKKLDEVQAGGFGGNLKLGKLIYDGLSKNLASLTVQRDPINNSCLLKNNEITVKDYRTKEVAHFNCVNKDPEHNNIYWNADFDAINGGYSPSNDAMYAGKIIEGLYQDWYGIPPLKRNDGKPMMLEMLVHLDDDNAYWDGRRMIFGDGIEIFYPLTSLGVAAHEVSHGFTQQHSNLFYRDAQSGGLNESFSDMAAQAAEFYSTGKNTWQIGAEVFKANRALRYMDEPTKDCKGRTPGRGCSISHMDQFNPTQNVHYTSGIFNKVYYLMGTATGWNAKKAFDVMVKANMAYWRTRTDFQTAGNCILKAAKDLNYDLNTVQHALSGVGLKNVNAENCM